MKSQRYYLIDFARGIAAFSVLFWHYQHFFVPPSDFRPIADFRALEPGHWLLWPLYDYGVYAVAFFWMISGLVFTVAYSGETTSSKEFVVHRFARLYPLHFVTLLLVGLLQFVVFHRTGAAFMSQVNDARHFVMHLFLASNWIGRGGTYNGVIWSVSVEIVIYAVFWSTRHIVARRPILFPAVMVCLFGLADLAFARSPVPACGGYFYLGCLIAALHRHLPLASMHRIALIGLATMLGIWGFAQGTENAQSIAGITGLGGALLLALVTIERPYSPATNRRLGIVGDSTYGLYLWHFPIQITLFLLLGRADGLIGLARNGWFLLLFLALAITAARLGFVYIERPAQRRLRRLAQSREWRDGIRLRARKFVES